MRHHRSPPLVASAVWMCVFLTALGGRAAPPLSPAAIVGGPDGSTFFVACATANEVAVITRDGTVRQRLAMPAAPSGLALSPDGQLLAVACAAPQSTVCLLDPAHGTIVARLAAGHTALAPVFSGDGSTLFVCERFLDDVAAFDVKTQRLLARIRVDREPVASALSRDGRRLFVANHLHICAATADVVAASVSVIDTATRRVEQTISLPNGSGLLFGLATSPDGRFVAMTWRGIKCRPRNSSADG